MPETNDAAGGILNVLLGLLRQTGVQEALIKQATDAIARSIRSLFNRRPKPPKPVAPVTVPTPAPVQPDPNFPDDTIPRPSTVRKISRVSVALTRVQLSKERFPGAYTVDNPFGLADHVAIQQRRSKMNFLSKFWVTVSAYYLGADGKEHEFTFTDNLTEGRAYQTVIRVAGPGGICFIRGVGGDSAAPIWPAPGYEQVDTDEIGQGITAWGGDRPKGIQSTSLGFLQQFQAWAAADGKSFEISGAVQGVEATPFTIDVS